MAVNIDWNIKIDTQALIASLALVVSALSYVRAGRRDNLHWKRQAHLPYYRKLNKALKEVDRYIIGDRILPTIHSDFRSLIEEAYHLGLENIAKNLILLDYFIEKYNEEDPDISVDLRDRQIKQTLNALFAEHRRNRAGLTDSKKNVFKREYSRFKNRKFIKKLLQDSPKSQNK